MNYMKTIQQYQAEDGKIFNNSAQCIFYDEILKEVDEFLSTLPNPDKYNITNGEGYIQHEKGTYDRVEKKLVELANKWFKLEKPFTGFNYALGRYIDDSNMNCLNKLSYRLMSMKSDREYGQPYFALNPDKCKDIQVN